MSKTKLQLFQEFFDEAGGFSGDAPTTTINQTGQAKRGVRYIDTAYNDIQSECETWRFLRTSFTGSLTAAGGNTYTASNFSLDPDVSSWIVNELGREDDMRVYLTATGVSDEQPLAYVPYEMFRTVYMMGTSRTDTGRPQIITVTPANALMIHPIPDDTYTLVGEYYRVPHIFGEDGVTSADDDVPIFPAKFHDIIMWRALMFYAARYAEPDIEAEAEEHYTSLMAKMKFEQLPKPFWGPPLA